MSSWNGWNATELMSWDAILAMSPTKTKRSATLSFGQQELAVNLYDAANDEPKATFEQVAKKVVSRRFAKSKSSAAFKGRSTENVQPRPLDFFA